MMIECDYWHFPPCSHLEQETSGGHRVGSVQKDLKCQLHLLQLRKLEVTPSIKVVEEQHIAEKLPSVVTDVEGDTLARDTKSKKSILHSQPRTNHFFSFGARKIPSVVSVRNKTTRARCRIKASEARGWD